MTDASDFPTGGGTALRGTLVYCRDDPFLCDPADAFVCEPDGVVVCRDGMIVSVGPYEALKSSIGPAVIEHYPGCLIAPGFIDAHVHYVQTGMIASYGKGLLEWLTESTFPAEQELAEEARAQRMAAFFCDELLRNGTTSALVFCTVYPHSVDALFAEAAARNMRLVAGKVLMDRHVPASLRDTATLGYDQSKHLIGKWHNRGRNLYAITPRFAATSSPGQLEAAGALWKEYPDVLVQSHIAETQAEVAWVAGLYPDRQDYLEVYEHFGLTGRRAVLAHAIYLSKGELCRCHESGTALVHCPTSNLFLGSGLFRLRAAKDPRRPIHVGVGTDVGAGTSLSMLETLGAAYKVSQLNAAPISPVEALFLATLGGARALDLDDRIGTLRPGNEADLVVLDPSATPLLAFRNERARSVEEQLFVLMTLGDDRAVRATYIAGRLAHRRD